MLGLIKDQNYCFHKTDISTQLLFELKSGNNYENKFAIFISKTINIIDPKHLYIMFHVFVIMFCLTRENYNHHIL